MQECPSCLESFGSDDFIVPHCNERGHSACRDCTMQWYQKQSNETCMVCRVGKPPVNINPGFLAFGFGIVCSVLIVGIIMLHDWFVLLLKVYTYAMCYFYFKQIPCSMTTKQLVIVFFVGFNMTLYVFIMMFIYLSYSASNFIIFTVYNFITMIVYSHALHFVCTTCSTEETRKWLSFLNLVNKIASVSFFCIQVYQIYAII